MTAHPAPPPERDPSGRRETDDGDAWSAGQWDRGPAGPPGGPGPPGGAGRDVGVDAASDDPVGARLRELAGVLDGRDRMMGRAARLLVQVVAADGLPERLGGMTLQVWLEHVCRIPAGDARALLGAIDVLTRMPSLVDGLAAGWLSWLQVTAICRAARRVRVALLADLNNVVATAMVAMADVEPDALIDDVWHWVDTRQPTRLQREHDAADRAEYVSLQPKLTGGGSIHGEYGPINWTIIAERLSPATPPTAPDTHGHDADDLDDDTLADAYDTLDHRARAHTRDHGAATAARLLALCTNDTDTDADGDTGGSRGGGRRPLVIATIDLHTLLDTDRTPGWLLHTLAGGRMKVTTTALQALVDRRGADLRSVILDDCGQAVGVGRTTHVPPAWLRHAIWARDLAVADPDHTCPIRRADLDHIIAWPDGATDVTNLHPLGRRWHNHKTTTSWTVTRRTDGTTTWRHRHHGWTLRLAPPRRDLTNPPTHLPDPPPTSGTHPPPPTGTDPPPHTGTDAHPQLPDTSTPDPPTHHPRLAGIP